MPWLSAGRFLRRVAVVLVLLAVSGGGSGCASTSVYLGAGPGMHVAPGGPSVGGGGEIPVDAALEGLVRVVPIDMHGRVRGSDFGGEPAGRSLYLSVDVSGLIARPHLGVEPGEEFESRLRGRRNKIIDVLLAVADHNAETYLSRAFANRAVLSTSRNVLRDVALGTTSGLAAVGSPAASALGLTGLVLGAGVDEMNSALYLGETFHAMELVIRAERRAVRARIRERSQRSYAEYPMADALADVRWYSEACSVRFGLARLREAAEASARGGF